MMFSKRVASACTLLALGAILSGCPSQPSETDTKSAALQSVRKLAEQGDARAQYLLGTAYSNGDGVQMDLAKAAEWFEKAALQGDAEAQHRLGSAYSEGKGVTKDAARAFEWWQKAAAQGAASAQNSLGWAYDAGEGVLRDEAKAFEWFQKAAMQGLAVAQVNLGLSYMLGQGAAKDEAKAIEWWQKAAAQGSVDAQNNLGRAYFLGVVVPKDAAKAVELWQKGAAQGEAYAQANLGLAYSRGEGVPKDATKAVEWWQKAAAQGSADAQNHLGSAYNDGVGVSRDVVVGYAWANIAAVRGDKTLRDEIERYLTPAQRAEGQRLATNWKKGESINRESSAEPGRNESTAGGLAKRGAGTAFIVSTTGLALTNHHVVGSCRELRVAGRDGIAKLVTTDRVNDLALIQLAGSVASNAPLTAEPTRLRQGEEIVTFGFPLDTALSSGGNLTPGIVSALTGLGNNTNQIQITAPIQPGSSGSPVVDKKGQVVGMVSMKLSDSAMAKVTGSLPQNVNFAVNGQTLRAFLDANRVPYQNGTGFFAREKNSADLADEMRRWTVLLECWK